GQPAVAAEHRPTVQQGLVVRPLLAVEDDPLRIVADDHDGQVPAVRTDDGTIRGLPGVGSALPVIDHDECTSRLDRDIRHPAIVAALDGALGEAVVELLLLAVPDHAPALAALDGVGHVPAVRAEDDVADTVVGAGLLAIDHGEPAVAGDGRVSQALAV